MTLVYGYTDPFLKWAGGKRQLVDQLLPLFPTLVPGARYFEPFLGGGAVFFALSPNSAKLADCNPHLIEAYEAVRDDVERVIGYLASFDRSREAYYRMRKGRRRNPYSRAARFIYLNKLCFNGLYRENLMGQFNVPYGRPHARHVLCDKEQLRNASRVLATAELAAGDFETAVSDAQPDDFVYFDPPYITGHTTNGFVEYNANVFSWRDQARLAQLAGQLAAAGVHVAVSNAGHRSIDQLYKKCNLRKTIILRWSTMAGASVKRFATTEALYLSETVACT